MTTLQEITKFLQNPDRVKIFKDDELIFCDWGAMLMLHDENNVLKDHGADEVKKFRCIPEVTHKQWKEKGLQAPIEPDKVAEYRFSDLQMSLYYTIYI